MKRLDSTPWPENWLGRAKLNAVRDRIPLGYTLSLSGQSTRGPWRVLLLRDRTPIFDTVGADLEGTIDAALASIAPTDLENELAASLRARA